MSNQSIENELTSIRSLMERSSKFISLSGLSGIMAGIYALTGAAVSYHLVYSSAGIFKVRIYRASDLEVDLTTMYQLILIAALVFWLPWVQAFGSPSGRPLKMDSKYGAKPAGPCSSIWPYRWQQGFCLI
jgi:hypothetical protein